MLMQVAAMILIKKHNLKKPMHKELRFVKTYIAGYIIEPNSTTFYTPHIEAGDC